jgi:N-acetylneuraminic acid mutarotase
MSTVRYRHTATLLPDHTVLVAGGETAFTSLISTAEIYNPRTGAWTAAGSMPHPHSRSTAALLPNGEVLVAGGSTGKDSQVSLESGTSSVDIYDPAGHHWYRAGSMRSNRAEQGAALLSDGRLLQIGGYTSQGSVTATMEVFSASAPR